MLAPFKTVSCSGDAFYPKGLPYLLLFNIITNARADERHVVQTFDEIDASVAAPDKRSIQVVRYPAKRIAYPSPSPGTTVVGIPCGVPAP